MKDRTFLGASIVAAIVASFCCILPIVFAVAGISMVGTSALFAAWRPYVLAGTFVLLVLGFYYAYRPARQACEPGGACTRPAINRSGRVTLWIAVVLVLAFAAFPYYSGPVAGLILANHRTSPGEAHKPSGPAAQRALLAIDGLDCPACAASLEAKLRAIPGVSGASVSYEQRRAEVEYDGSVVGLEAIENIVGDTGVRVRRTSPRNPK